MPAAVSVKWWKAYAYDPSGNRAVEQIDDAVTGWTHDSMNRFLTQEPSGALRLMRLMGTVSEPAAVALGGKPVAVSGTNQFEGSAPIVSGTTPFSITATDPSGNSATNNYEVDSSGSGKTFTFDANGNITSDGGRVFEWDARDRLTAITVGLHRTEFSYNGLGRRIRSVEKENSTVQQDQYSIWCNDELCETRRAENGERVRAVFPLGAVVNETPQFNVGDHLGSVWQVTTNQGVLLSRYTYDPSGRRFSAGPSDSSLVGYTGHEWHAASGLWLALYRSHDPNLGVWLSQDPAGFDGGMNWYTYAENNPISFDDPLGLAITCRSSLSKRHVTKITRKGCEGAWGCTSIQNLDPQPYKCEYDRCTKTWWFDALVSLTLLVEFSVREDTAYRPGGTVGGHEKLHVSDFQRGCRALNNKIKTEGFKSPGACSAALRTFPLDVFREMNDVSRRTGEMWDKKP
jgi:RHS repeat-associated protein